MLAEFRIVPVINCDFSLEKKMTEPNLCTHAFSYFLHFAFLFYLLAFDTRNLSETVGVNRVS